MTCREIVDFLLEYEAGELAPDQRGCFEAHLAECPDCVEYLRSYEATIRLARQACSDQHRCPADVPEDLVRAILDARTPRPEHKS